MHYPLAVHGPTHPQIASMNYQRPPISAGANTTPSNRSSQSTTQTSEQDDSSSDGKDFLTPKSTAKNMGKTPKSTARTPKNTVKTHQAKRSFNYHQPSSNQLDYFANNHFSRSFNSLILDDIKDELTASGKKTINKSPPFNVKHDYYGDNDSLDDCIEDDDKLVAFDSDINDTKADTDVNDTRADDDDFDHTQAYQSPTLKEIKPKKLFRRDGTHNTSTDPDVSSNSQQSSIKRSFKFLNLSIDSSNKALDLYGTGTNKILEDDIDYISDLNEIGAPFGNSPIESRNAATSVSPVNAYSPRENKTPLNKFKRPHQLVSQSPSPSSQKYLTSKNSFYNQHKHNSQNESLSNYISN